MSEVTERFAELMRGPEDALALDEAALLVAAHAYPGLDIAANLGQLDELAARCTSADLESVVHHVFRREWFMGNRAEYQDVRNSFLNDVLARRVGIPLSLSIVLIEIGRRVGVTIHGVGMPAHFLARSGDVWIDAFDTGRLMDRDGCFELFLRLGGSPQSFDPSFLEPVGVRAIIARMLANLRSSYLRAGDGPGLAWVGRLRSIVPGVPPQELAEQARLLVQLGRFGEAADALEQLAVSLGDGEADRVATEAGQLRARLN